MKPTPLEPDGHCYVLLQGNWIHPIAHRRFELSWYPERGMTLTDQYLYRPYVQSIVTECAWLIGCYDRENVRIVREDGTWGTPDTQTYGSSADWIQHLLLKIPSTVSATPLDGGRSMRTAIEKYAARIEKAKSLYK